VASFLDKLKRNGCKVETPSTSIARTEDDYLGFLCVNSLNPNQVII